MNIDLLKARLAVEEGDRLVAYLDTLGILTVGIGHNCRAKPVDGVSMAGDRITPEVEHSLFESDVEDACAQLDNHLPWWRDLDDARQNVMLDLCFNMGINTLVTFRNTLNMIEHGAFKDAADAMQHSLWHKQVGARAVWLENVMRTGVYS